MTDIKAQSDHLVMAAAIRILAWEIANLANAPDKEVWFLALGESVFNYIDRTSNPQMDEPTLKAVKEAAYDTLRMVFDPRGFKAA
jgi:hypothetical protein